MHVKSKQWFINWIIKLTFKLLINWWFALMSVRRHETRQQDQELLLFGLHQLPSAASESAINCLHHERFKIYLTCKLPHSLHLKEEAKSHYNWFYDVHKKRFEDTMTTTTMQGTKWDWTPTNSGYAKRDGGRPLSSSTVKLFRWKC